MEVVRTALAYATSTAVLCTACLVAGVVFSQKIKDWVSGTSAEFRSAMNSVETKAKSDVKAAVADVFAKIVPAPVAPPEKPAVVTAAVTPAPAPEAPHA
jgi:hypothetical protein